MGITIYDSRDSFYKNPFGAVGAGESVQFALKLPKSLPVDQVRLLVYPADCWDTPITVPMEYAGSDLTTNRYRCVYSHPQPQLLYYQFGVLYKDSLNLIRNRGRSQGYFGLADGLMWQLTVYDPEGFTSPPPGGMMYQIFPDRFYNSKTAKKDIPGGRTLREDWGALPEFRPDSSGEVTNSDYFCGDLAGIAEKLDYFSSLGVSVIYLNPIFEAHSNHRYNTADYSKIDPLLGDEGDFRNLCAKAKEQGITIILDGVFSHTGSDSIYFNKNNRYGKGGAYNDAQSPYFPWYGFTSHPDEYNCWWGFPTLPAVNELDPGFSEFICGEKGILKKWLSLGAGGWRLDVADELPDGFLDLIRTSVKAFSPECPVIGEVWEDASNKISYGQRRRYLLGKQLDTVMNYPFKDGVLNYIRYGGGRVFYEIIMRILENYPPPVINLLMNFLSTHDTVRAITALAGEEMGQHDREWQAEHHYLNPEQYDLGVKRLKLASILQFGLPGVPCVYYGDEAGLSGYKDPFNRVCYPWGHEDKELVQFIAKLGRMRKDNSLLMDASFLPLHFTDQLCSFIRRGKRQSLYFSVNRSDNWQSPVIPLEFEQDSPLIVSGDFKKGSLSPLSGIILKSYGNA